MEDARCVRRLLAAAVLAASVTSCNHPVPPPPTAPEPPAVPVPPPPPNPPAAAPQSLTITVLKVTDEGRQPIQGATVYIVDLEQGPYGWLPWYGLTTDVNGQAVHTYSHSGRVVKLTAYEKSGLGPLSVQSRFFQVRAVHPTLGKDLTVEIELVGQGGRPQITDSPILSGIVFETTPNGRRPVADMDVLYTSNGDDGADVYTRTDGEGRYRFWNLPVGSGYVLPACTADWTKPPNFRLITFPVAIMGDTVLDVACS